MHANRNKVKRRAKLLEAGFAHQIVAIDYEQRNRHLKQRRYVHLVPFVGNWGWQTQFPSRKIAAIARFHSGLTADLYHGRVTMLDTDLEAETTLSDIEEIGLAAGKVWCFLDLEGPASLNKITKNLNLSRELAMQAVGWLAREDKIVFEQAIRGRLIRLK